MIKQRTRLFAVVSALGLVTSGCANMGVGGYLGMAGGAVAGGYAGSQLDDGSGTMTAVGAVIGGSMGMVLGSGAVTPGEMVQAASDARVVETISEAANAPAPVNPYAAPSGSTAGTASSSTTAVGVAAPSGAAAEETFPDKSVAVYFSVGMVPTERNTRNPMCYSNTFHITIPFNPRGWGNGGRVNAILDPMKDDFYAKCARLGQVTSPNNVSYGAEGVHSGFPRSAPHAEDFTVTMP